MHRYLSWRSDPGPISRDCTRGMYPYFHLTHPSSVVFAECETTRDNHDVANVVCTRHGDSFCCRETEVYTVSKLLPLVLKSDKCEVPEGLSRLQMCPLPCSQILLQPPSSLSDLLHTRETRTTMTLSRPCSLRRSRVMAPPSVSVVVASHL